MSLDLLYLQDVRGEFKILRDSLLAKDKKLAQMNKAFGKKVRDVHIQLKKDDIREREREGGREGGRESELSRLMMCKELNHQAPKCLAHLLNQISVTSN